MTLQARDKRALILLGVASFLLVGWWISTPGDVTVKIVGVSESAPSAERRLLKLRQVAAMVPGKEVALNQVRDELATRERGLIQADTAAQAQAQLLQIIARIAKSQDPPVSIRSREIGAVKPYSGPYGEVAVSVNFEMQVEQLVNFLTDLTAQKELIATSDVRIGTANPKQKSMPVRLTISGLVRRDLLPDKKGTETF